jgi:hypothetical protein
VSIYSARTRRDRYADGAVLLLVLVSLLLGLAMRTAVSARSTRYALTTGVTVYYPQGWLRQKPEGALMQVRDPEAGGFATTYQVRSLPLAAGTSPTTTLTTALTNVSLSRGQRATAYRVLEILPGEELLGTTTMQQTFGYVAENYDPFAEKLPVVVAGLDVALGHEGQAFVFTLLAEPGAFDDARGQFWRFVRSVEFD